MAPRDWQLTSLVAAFVGVSFYLWTLPITPERLFLIATPLGIVVLALFLWLVRRT